MNDAKAKIHATLGASSASRWMACPGSVRLSETAPPRPDTIHSREGTSAHAVAELALTKNLSPAAYVGLTIEGVEVTDEMAEYVSVFVDYCRAQQAAASKSWVERQFSLHLLNPPAPMFGTADFVSLDTASGVLEVVDLKYGQGVVVDVNENKQLRYYGLGALLSLDPSEYAKVQLVKITIVQPRATHADGVIRSEVLALDEILDFTSELMDAARATIADDAPLAPGSHCRWCPASGACPAQHAKAQLIAQTEFPIAADFTPPVPALTPIPTLAEYAGKFHILEEWMGAVRARLQGELEAGRDVPGYKLVARRANRSWVDADQTVQWLKAQGKAEAEIYEQKLRSPAQIEKVVGKKNLPIEMTQKVSSGTTMVPSDDPRDAVQVVVGSEFLLQAAAPEGT